MEDPEKSLKQLTSVEEAAEDILRDRSEIIALDRRRQSNREGVRALISQTGNRAWVALGPVLVRLPVAQAKQLIDDDQKATDIQINTLRSGMKDKYYKLRDLEYQEQVPGLDLKPLSRDEMTAVKQVLGIV